MRTLLLSLAITLSSGVYAQVQNDYICSSDKGIIRINDSGNQEVEVDLSEYTEDANGPSGIATSVDWLMFVGKQKESNGKQLEINYNQDILTVSSDVAHEYNSDYGVKPISFKNNKEELKIKVKDPKTWRVSKGDIKLNKKDMVLRVKLKHKDYFDVLGLSYFTSLNDELNCIK